MSLEILFDKSAIEAMIANYGATDKQARKAAVSALRKLRKNVQTLVKRQVAKKENIPQKALNKRVYGSKVDDDAVLTIWVGTKDVMPHQIGNPVQDAKGVKVGRYRAWTGAFIANPFRSGEAVWIRMSSKHYTPALYPSADWRAKVPGKQGNRFPIVKVGVPIEESVAEVIEGNQQEIMDLFMRRLDQELNYYVNVRGRS